MAENPLNSLLSKEVDRKEFLLFLGTIILTLVGVSSLMKSIASITNSSKQQKGFGGGPYGQ